MVGLSYTLELACVSNQQFTYMLPDGSTVQVDEKVYIALHQLQVAMSAVAAGQISNLSLIEVDKDGNDRTFLLVGDTENFEVLHRELLHQSAVALELAKSWKGNVSPEVRSYSRH